MSQTELLFLLGYLLFGVIVVALSFWFKFDDDPQGGEWVLVVFAVLVWPLVVVIYLAGELIDWLIGYVSRGNRPGDDLGLGIAKTLIAGFISCALVCWGIAAVVYHLFKLFFNND